MRKSNGSNLAELSLAENFAHAPLHPADQFEAFAKLQSEGLPAEDIAARFGLSSKLVTQRLKLGAVSPRLMAEYRKDAMTLEQLMAFTLSDDHALQEEAWFGLGYYDMPPYDIRRFLTQTKVGADDRRALFVGAEAYQAAGGTILRDLFDEEGEGYFSDSQLLDRLVAGRLEVEAEGLRAEGWKWVETAIETNYEHLAQFGRVKAIEKTLSAKEEKRLVRLAEKYDALVAALEEEENPDKSSELDRVSADMKTLQRKKEDWAPEDKARSGALLCLDYDGMLKISRGLVKAADRHSDEGDTASESARPRKAKRSGEYPDSLLADLSAHRTAALREVLTRQPEHALTALLHALAGRIFFGAYRPGCIGISPAILELDRYSKSVGASRASSLFLQSHAHWQERLPDPDSLWDWISGLAPSERASLLAHCVAMTVDALWRRNGGNVNLHEADRLAQVLSLDMAAWWRPTRENFLGSVSKDRIVQIVTEGVSARESKRLILLKKADMAERAEVMLADTSWLPEPLRTTSADAMRKN